MKRYSRATTRMRITTTGSVFMFVVIATTVVCTGLLSQLGVVLAVHGFTTSTAASSCSSGFRRRSIHISTTTGTTTTTTTTRASSSVRLYYDGTAADAAITTTRPKYVRWQPTADGGWAMQTAVTTFEKKKPAEDFSAGSAATTGDDRLELHAQLHFGDASYYEYYNSKQFNQGRTVLFELLVDESLLSTATCNDQNNNNKQEPAQLRQQQQQQQQRTVTCPLSASPQDQQTAHRYGWSCQVDVIQYDQSNWIHADLSRQEFLNYATGNQQQQKQQAAELQVPLWQFAAASSSKWNNNNNNNNNPPLIIFPAAAVEAATALLVGPPILEPEFAQRRLFSNLFLPGNALAQVLRAILWFTVPSPELSILLLDWSSLLVLLVNHNDNNNNNSSNRRHRRTRSTTGGGGGGFNNDKDDTAVMVSPITMPLLQAVASARLDHVRRLVFGQVIVASSQIHRVTGGGGGGGGKAGGGGAYELLIPHRNDKALSVLTEIRHQQKSQQQSSIVALLYGCSHCPDLHQKLLAMGYIPRKTEWRTAWTVATSTSSNKKTTTTMMNPTTTTTTTKLIKSDEQQRQQVMVFLAVAIPLYFIIGGLDWMSTLGQFIILVEERPMEGLVPALLYLARHVLLYVGLSKVLLDWE